MILDTVSLDVTFYASKKKPAGQRRTTTWRELAELLTTPTPTPCDCDKATGGWPCDKTMEELRDRFARERAAAAADEVVDALEQMHQQRRYGDLRDLIARPYLRGDVVWASPNETLQQVLKLLMLSPGKRRDDQAGFISYAELGINQLGAVYEGLMAYSGFFATEELVEVAKGGDPSDGSDRGGHARAVGLDAGNVRRQRLDLEPVEIEGGRHAADAVIALKYRNLVALLQKPISAE